MINTPKDVYKTIKRSISSTTNTLVFGNGSSGSSTLSRFVNSPSSGVSPPTKYWIHPPENLVKRRVDYSVRMLGKTEVSEAKGTHVVRDAMHAIRFQLQLQKGLTGHSGSKLKKVDLQISIDGLNVVDSKTGIILYKHPLHRISFCADDKQDKRAFSYIAKTEDNKHVCFIFLSDKLAEKITWTIGQAFDLAYERFVRRNGGDLEQQKQMILLQKKVAELEAENKQLKKLLNMPNGGESSNENGQNKGDLINITAPVLPKTPIPPVPPAMMGCLNSTTQLNLDNFQLAPPPQNSKRSNPPNANNDVFSSLNEVFLQEKPEVGTKLPNLQLEDLFDDEFDPRAHEKKFKEHKGNLQNGLSSAEKSKAMVEDFEELLRRVDESLEMRNGFQTLEQGDLEDSARDLDYEELQTTSSTPTPNNSNNATNKTNE